LRAGIFSVASTALMILAATARVPAWSADPSSSGASPGCGSLPAALAPVARDWRQSGRNLPASPAAPPGANLRLKERVHAELLPLEAVSLSKQPPKAPRAGTFAGLFAFRTDAAGLYRVSSDEKVWVELIAVSSGEPAIATHSDKRLRCAGIIKDIVFELKAGTGYWLQVTGSTRPSIGLMVYPAND
jgi:hypothetical protein